MYTKPGNQIYLEEMTMFKFDLFETSQAQVRTFLRNKAQAELKGGIYLWVNKSNGHFYVGSSLNF